MRAACVNISSSISGGKKKDIDPLEDKLSEMFESTSPGFISGYMGDDNQVGHRRRNAGLMFSLVIRCQFRTPTLSFSCGGLTLSWLDCFQGGEGITEQVTAPAVARTASLVPTSKKMRAFARQE